MARQSILPGFFFDFCHNGYCAKGLILKIKRMKLFKPVFETDEKIILRDYLALERTRLANERTLLSYLRASVYMILGGITFLQLEDFQDSRWIGLLTLVVSVITALFGLFRYFQIKTRLKNYYQSL